MSKIVFDEITREPYERRVSERVVYRNGQFLEDIPSFVDRQLRDVQAGVVTITTMIRRPSKGFEQAFEQLQEEYLTKHPVEDGIYPRIKYNGRSLEGQLYFEPAYREDGIILYDTIKRIDELRSNGYQNKRTTILMRVETYFPLGKVPFIQ